ncbi:hypothetical protein Goarm_005337 [Gossypium armourianum]|uniref:Glucose-1-phosphate adenylyltransferase/Bifunctional protein GlmU-like C-terminal hexapeptide domain-containing protein n=1 Tax=Gossypium armourianum TaxID=34283 RepID=A0A7J9JZL6_9ROSI|nr:hypothetical protein [Gossypium armourianum]
MDMYCSNTYRLTLLFLHILFSVKTETGADVDDGQEFLKWKNGGGHFHKSACIDPTVVIEIGAIVHPKSVLGANVHVGSGTAIGPCVKIGQFTKIGYNAALSNCTVGDSCVIHNGVCIGQDGFGFFVDEDGNMVKKPQIGHNVVIGKSCMLCGQVGIAGSVIIGDYVVLGGRVAVRDHVSIISKVRLAANSCVTKDIREPGDYGGFPAVPIHVWRRQIAIQSRSSKKRKS